MTSPSGRGKKREVVFRQSIDDILLATKQRQNVSMVVYQDSILLVEASRLTFFNGEPETLIGEIGAGGIVSQGLVMVQETGQVQLLEMTF